MTINIQDKGKIGQMRVGEVLNFQQNLNGDLDLVVFVWPQTPLKLSEQIAKTPQMMGMTAETQPVVDHLCFPDGTTFDTVDDPDADTIEKLRADIEALQSHIAVLEKVLSDHGMIKLNHEGHKL